MAMFTNKSVNYIYVHAGLQALVMSGGEGFAFVYLLKAGISTPVVLLCMGAMFGSRLLFRKAVLPVVLRFGLRRTLMVSVIVEGASYLLLPMVEGVGLPLLLYLGFWAVSSSFYWTTYHAFVSSTGNNEHRGTQVSTMEFFAMLAGVVGPLIMGFLLTWFNPWVGFGFISIAMLLAALPFLFCPDVEVARDVSVPAESRRIARLLMLADGLRSSGTHFVWLIALFLTLGSSYVAFGGALALAGITGAFMGLFVGKWIDVGKGIHAARFGFGAMAFSSLVKCFGFHIPLVAVTANALYSAAWPSYATSLNSQIYNLAQKSPCPLRYNISSEGGWDLGMTLGSCIAALFIYLGYGFFWPLAVGIGGVVLGYVLIARVMMREEG